MRSRAPTFVPSVPRKLDDLVARMLSRDPSLRPKNAMAFLAELARIREGSHSRDPQTCSTLQKRTFSQATFASSEQT